MNQSLRLFVALKISASLFDKIDYAGLRNAMNFAQINWNTPEKLHITLTFLGDHPEAVIEKLDEILIRLSSEFPPFELSSNSFGLFKKNKQPTVLWLGLNQSETLNRLQQKMQKELESYSIGYISHPVFQPHITLGKIKHLPDNQLFFSTLDNHKILPQTFGVGAIHLYKSALHQSGAAYSILKSYPLSK